MTLPRIEDVANGEPIGERVLVAYVKLLSDMLSAHEARMDVMSNALARVNQRAESSLTEPVAVPSQPTPTPFPPAPAPVSPVGE